MAWETICKQALESLLTEGCGKGPRSVVLDTREKSQIYVPAWVRTPAADRQLPDVLLNSSDLGSSFTLRNSFLLVIHRTYITYRTLEKAHSQATLSPVCKRVENTG